MKVHPGALKHGVSSEDAIQAAEWSLWIEPLDENGPPVQELHLDRFRHQGPTAGEMGSRLRER